MAVLVRDGCGGGPIGPFGRPFKLHDPPVDRRVTPSTVTVPRRPLGNATGAAWLNDNAITRLTSVSMALPPAISTLDA